MDIRLFLAFELPQEIRELIDEISGEAGKLPLDVRWVRTENIHLTVVFAGNVDESMVFRFEEVACLACGRSHPFEISLHGLGFFGNFRNPRVLWVGLNGDVKEMSRLRDDLQKGLAPFGVKKETRPFRPHLTLGRFKKKVGSVEHLKRLLEKYRELTSPTAVMKALTLFRSDLKKDGAVYTKINRWSLGESERH